MGGVGPAGMQAPPAPQVTTDERKQIMDLFSKH
jgi:penicillin-binding protein 1A